MLTLLPAGLAIAFPVVTGAAIGISTAQETRGNWYKELKKPSFNPPNWVFGPAWTFLYASMGYASYRIWLQGGFEAQAFPLALYGLNLALNFSWTPLFFVKKKLGLALAEIGCLWFVILACIRAFRPVDELASNLLIPYLGWVSFASLLNLRIWQLNPYHSAKPKRETK
eukprot:Colp12_sorted_trinity150504_noHs@29811